MPPPDPARREAAIGAALAAAKTEVVAPARPAVRAHRRSRWLAPMAAAAAVVVVVVGGIVAVRRDDTDDDTASRTDEATTQLVEGAAESGADEADQEREPTIAAGSATTAAAAPADAATSQAGAEGTEAAAETTAAAASEATTGAAGGAAEPGLPIVRTGADLVALQELFAVARDSPEAAAPTSVAPRCAAGDFLTLAQYEPSPTLTPQEVEIYVDGTGAVLAVDATTCVEVLRTAP